MTSLTQDQVALLAPAAFSESHEMSTAYRQVNTSQLLDQLAQAGYLPVSARQDNPRSRDPMLVTHEIVLRHEDHITNSGSTGQHPQITLINSHNGRTKLRLFAGFFRIVCLNGLTVGDPAFTHTLRHQGDAMVEAMAFAEESTLGLKRADELTQHWASMELNQREAIAFAEAAVALRFGTATKTFDPASLLEPRREEDEGRTLWQVFNTVQEHAMRGGVIGTGASGRKVRSGALTAIGPSNAFNTKLWNLAAQFAA